MTKIQQINCEETPITFDSPLSDSLAKIGQKTITVKTTGKEKTRITALLTIYANGEKLMPYIIFKAKKDSIINNDLKKYIKERKFNIITTTQNNAWIDEEIFINYIETILSKYKAGTKKLLIMDYCTAHCTDKIFETLKNKNIDYIFIPKHMTPVLQPLDRMVNFPFKKYLKTKFSEYLMFANEKEESIGEARKRILNDINEIWFDNSNKYSGINADNIIKSFKITGISNNMDGTRILFFMVIMSLTN